MAPFIALFRLAMALTVDTKKKCLSWDVCSMPLGQQDWTTPQIQPRRNLRAHRPPTWL